MKVFVSTLWFLGLVAPVSPACSGGRGELRAPPQRSNTSPRHRVFAELVGSYLYVYDRISGLPGRVSNLVVVRPTGELVWRGICEPSGFTLRGYVSGNQWFEALGGAHGTVKRLEDGRLVFPEMHNTLVGILTRKFPLNRCESDCQREISLTGECDGHGRLRKIGHIARDLEIAGLALLPSGDLLAMARKSGERAGRLFVMTSSGDVREQAKVPARARVALLMERRGLMVMAASSERVALARERRVDIHDLATGTRIDSIQYEQPLSHLAWDGQRLFAAAGSGQIWIREPGQGPRLWLDLSLLRVAIAGMVVDSDTRRVFVAPRSLGGILVYEW